MRDRNYDKLAKKGWAEMEVVLDKELPTQRRRKGFLWLFLAIGILSSIAGISYFIGENESTENISSLASEAESAGNSEAGADSGRTNIENQTNKNKLPTKAVLTARGNNIIEAVKAAESSQVRIENVKATNRNEDVGIATAKREGSKMKSEESLVLMGDTHEKVATAKDSLEDLRVSVYEARETGIVLKEIIPSADRLDQLPLLRLVSHGNIDLNPRVSKQKVIMPMYFILEAGASYTSYNNMRGFYAGMGFEKNVSRRWSFRTGVRYMAFATEKYYTSSLGSSDFFNQFDMDVPNISTPAEVQEDMTADKKSLDDEQYEMFISQAQKMQVLSIPLYGTYQLSRRNKVGVGVTYHALLSTSPSELLHSGNGGAIYAGSFNTSNVTRKNLLNLSSVYSYNLYKGLSLELASELGLTGIFRAQNRQGLENTLTYIGAGLTYRL